MIFKGNHIYTCNTFKLPANQPNLDVQNVLQLNHEEFQKIKIGADMGFVSTQHLEDFLGKYQNQHPKFAGVLIVHPDKSMLLCSDQLSTSLFKSHTWPAGRNNIHKFLSQHKELCEISGDNGQM